MGSGDDTDEGFATHIRPDINELRFFKLRLKQDLKAITEVYKDFNVGVDRDFLVLRYSPPPIPYRVMIQRPENQKNS